MALNDVEHCEACQIHEDVVKAVTDHMPDEDQLYDLAEVFKVFGDSTRIKILYVLFEAELCVCDIAQLLNNDPVCYFPPAADLKAEPPCKKPQGRKIRFLFPCRWPCKDDHQSGNGAYPGVVKKLFYYKEYFISGGTRL